MILGTTYLFVYNNSVSGRTSNSNMVYHNQADSSIRLMGMLMTISLGVIVLLFLYILYYNMTLSLAGTTTVGILLIIVLAFIIVLLKTLKLMNKLVLNSQFGDIEQPAGISTIEDLTNQIRIRHDSLPPSYDEAVKNCASTNISDVVSLPKYSQTFECPRCLYPTPNDTSTNT